MSLAPATAVRLLASAVAWKTGKDNKIQATGDANSNKLSWSVSDERTNLQHGLWVRQLFTLVDLNVSLQGWQIKWTHISKSCAMKINQVASSFSRLTHHLYTFILLAIVPIVHYIRLCNLLNSDQWVKSWQTLKYSRRSLQVTLLPPISFSTSRSGARSRGTNSASSLLKSPSMSKTTTNKHSHAEDPTEHKHLCSPADFSSHYISMYMCIFLFGVSPLSLPSKYGLVATLSPGCGSRKQPILEKQEWMCFLTFCNSSCWFCFT